MQILIVDEEEHLLWALEKNLLPERDDIKVITASSGELGLELLRREPIDVLICDIKMPGKVDGFQLILRAKEVAPDARVVIMTAFGTNRIQNLADRIGITHYIEKPFNISDLRNVVLELLDAKEGFQGVLSDLELTDIIQMLCLAKRTALLHLKHKEHRGKIVFERGDVTHAEFDDITGADAVYEMLALRQGDIYMQSDFQNDHRTIQIGWQDLLLEGVRRSDESNIDFEDDDPLLMEDSGEIPLGMPPRLTPEYEEAEPVADIPSFFSAAELAEIENAANGHEPDSETEIESVMPGRALLMQDPEIVELGSEQTSDLFFRHEMENAESSTTEESEPEDGLPPGLEEDSAQSVQPVSPAVAFNPDFHNRPRRPEPQGPVSEPAGRVSMPTPSSIPTVIARELEEPSEIPPVPEARASSETSSEALPMHHGRNRSGGFASPMRTSGVFQNTRQLHAVDPNRRPGDLHGVLSDFARECAGLHTTGVFTLDDGIALGAVHGMTGQGYDADTLAAFFRDVVAGAIETIRALHPQDEFQELQLMLEREIILLRAIEGTPYVHIAAASKDVRLGIALVLMRRYAQHLAHCF